MQTQHSFFASLQTLDENTHTAKFYIMNTSSNRNRWGVTAQALQEALPTLKGKPIGMGSGYRTEKHFSDTMNCGAFTDYEFCGSYALANAKITDSQTWQMLKNKEIGPISVVIACFSDVCSKCSANLRGIDQPERSHGCFTASETYSKVESFTFTRVDFVDAPAYPQAGVIEMSAAYYGPRYATLNEAVRDMRSLFGFPAHSGESEFTISTGACHPAKIEQTPKEAAALADAIEKMRVKMCLASGYKS